MGQTKTADERLADLETGLAASKVQNDDIVKSLHGLNERLAAPDYGGARLGLMFKAGVGPYGSTGLLGEMSRPYSFCRAAQLANGFIKPDAAKVEHETSERLKSWYGKHGFGMVNMHPQSFLVPISSDHMPPAETEEDDKFAQETRVRVKAWGGAFDPEEAQWVNQRMGGRFNHLFKTLGTVSDLAGGALVGFPFLGEIIELLRNVQAFAQAGSTEVTLPPNGRLQLPKLTGGSTCYAIGEGVQITDSTPTTGSLTLEAKKYAVLVKMNNELLRFTSPTTEGLFRTDMALQAGLKLDLDMLTGTGGTSIKGLTTYTTGTSWVQGQDKLLAYSVTSNKFQPNDPGAIDAILPDMAVGPDASLAWLMRRNMWSVLRNRRATAITANDQAGNFMFNLTREIGDRITPVLEGAPVIRSSQISNTRGSGAQTYVVYGNFRHWIIGRFGVMEFLANGLGDTPFQNDQTWLRGIMHADAGPRHASAFVFADAIDLS